MLSDSLPAWHPGWIPLFAVIALFFAALVWLAKEIFPKVDRKKQLADSMEMATRLALVGQRVKSIRVSPGFVTLDTLSNSDDMEEACLYFPSNHPDYEHLSRVARFSVIHFEFQAEPIRKINSYDPVAYL